MVDPLWLTRAADLLERQAAPAHDYRGVLPMIISETGAADEPELERIICAAISGGADYVNNMPRELVLERITPEGSTFERYIQADVDIRSDVRLAPAPTSEVIQAYQTGYRDARADAQQTFQANKDELTEEISELVRWLRLTGNGQPCLSIKGYERLIRAADLIEQLQIQAKC